MNMQTYQNTWEYTETSGNPDKLAATYDSISEHRQEAEYRRWLASTHVLRIEE